MSKYAFGVDIGGTTVKMGLFNEIKCVNCGKKTGMMTRTKLSDGQYICSKCTSGLPVSISSRLNEYDYDGFKRLQEYMEYSNNELSKIFRENHSFYSIHIDTEHRLFYLDGDHPRVYYKFEEVSEYDMEFIADEVKEGFLNTKVNGNIYYKIKVDFPSVFKEEALAKNVKAKAEVKTGLFKDKVKYDNPKGMNEFNLHFVNAWQASVNDMYSRLARELEEENYEVPGYSTNTSELQTAMALFMFDDLSEVTLEKLDKQRKRLLKTFHPDEGSSDDTGFAQKINTAYDVLKKAVA